MDNFSPFKVTKTDIGYGNIIDIESRAKGLQKAVNDIAADIPMHYSPDEKSVFLHALKLVQINMNLYLGKEIVGDGEI